jgi:hypothetical protein
MLLNSRESYTRSNTVYFVLFLPSLSFTPLLVRGRLVLLHVEFKQQLSPATDCFILLTFFVFTYLFHAWENSNHILRVFNAL